jgi:hypothetical protein
LDLELRRYISFLRVVLEVMRDVNSLNCFFELFELEIEFTIGRYSLGNFLRAVERTSSKFTKSSMLTFKK